MTTSFKEEEGLNVAVSTELLTEKKSSLSTSSSSILGWPIKKAIVSKPAILEPQKTISNDGSKLKNRDSNISEVEMMKERFAKLLLGEDMSGNGKGVCSALALSNAITNLCATIFGQLWRLEPLPSEKKSMWQREIECLLCVADHIVELIPTWQTFSDGKKLEVMTCRARTDIFINLPALRKLDNMLIDILDSFRKTEFWYIDQGVVTPDCNESESFRKTLHRQKEKWWLPVPRVPAGGLSESSRKRLDHLRECTHQILKAAVSINSMVLADMDVPLSYLESLPKNGRACLGVTIYSYITSNNFAPECLLDCLDISTEHDALEIADRVEEAIYVWRRRLQSNPSQSTPKSSWGMVKDLMVTLDKTDILAERAERLLVCLKHRLPNLTQTSLDTSKIQCNKDVGKSILESYSRVLESLAFSIISRIDDLLHVDNLTKKSVKKASVISTPSRASVISPARVERTPFFNRDMNKLPKCSGLGVRKALSNYLGGELKPKNIGSPISDNDSENIDPRTPQRASLVHLKPSRLR